MEEREESESLETVKCSLCRGYMSYEAEGEGRGKDYNAPKARHSEYLCAECMEHADWREILKALPLNARLDAKDFRKLKVSLSKRYRTQGGADQEMGDINAALDNIEKGEPPFGRASTGPSAGSRPRPADVDISDLEAEIKRNLKVSAKAQQAARDSIYGHLYTSEQRREMEELKKYENLSGSELLDFILDGKKPEEILEEGKEKIDSFLKRFKGKEL